MTHRLTTNKTKTRYACKNVHFCVFILIWILAIISIFVQQVPIVFSIVSFIVIIVLLLKRKY